MLRLRYWSWIGLLGGSLLAGSACAPVAAPEVGEARTLPAENPPTPATLSSKGSAAPDILRQRIELAIHSVRERELLTTHGFWTIFHGILGLGPQQTFLKDPRTGQQYNALDYICSGNPVRGLEFLPTPYGLDVRSATTPELVFVAQGHQDQFIAEMAQWGMPLDREFLVQGKTYHFRDFVRQAQMRASLRPGPDGKQQELSWTILIIGQYLGTEAEWTNQYGEHLRLADLLEYELNQPMQTAACASSTSVGCTSCTGGAAASRKVSGSELPTMPYAIRPWRGSGRTPTALSPRISSTDQDRRPTRNDASTPRATSLNGCLCLCRMPSCVPPGCRKPPMLCHR
jgi:hypothetical protein